MRRIITFTAFSLLFLIAIMCSCTQRMHVTDTVKNFTIACDTITMGDSSWYQPVTFKLKNRYLKHTNFFEGCQFRIIERAEKGFLVLATCNDHFYLVEYDFRPGGYIRFTHPDRVINFKILNIIKL